MELVKAAPKSQQLAGFLREKIVSGDLAVGSRLMTSRELAGKFSVSKQVVQSAFSQLEKERLITTHVGRGTYVAEQKTSIKSAGLIIPGLSDEHNTLPLLLQSNLQKLRYHVNIYDMDTIASHGEILAAYLKSNPDVMIVDAYSKLSLDFLSNIPKSTRLIFVNRFEFSERVPDASYILLDYRKMGYLCAKQLMKVGSRRIALISFERQPEFVSELFASGCEDAISEHGMGIFHFIDSVRCGDSYYRDLLTSPDSPDGFISTSAFRILPIVKILSDPAFTGNRDIPVIAGNETPWSEAFDLTSIDRREADIPAAIEYVFNSGENVDIKIEPKLVFRQSCPEKR